MLCFTGLRSWDIALGKAWSRGMLCFALVRRLGTMLTTDGDRFSRERPRFNDTLDMIKFICKDLWVLVFRKQIDNLKTNHRVWPSPMLRHRKGTLG